MVMCSYIYMAPHMCGMWPVEIYFLSVWNAVLEISDVGLGNRKTGVSLQQTLALLQDFGQCIAMQLRLALIINH